MLSFFHKSIKSVFSNTKTAPKNNTIYNYKNFMNSRNVLSSFLHVVVLSSSSVTSFYSVPQAILYSVPQANVN